MSKEIDYSVLSERDAMRAQAAADLLHPDQHVPGCPAQAGASMSCVYPAACCVFDEWEPIDLPGGGVRSCPTPNFHYGPLVAWLASPEAQQWHAPPPNTRCCFNCGTLLGNEHTCGSCGKLQPDTALAKALRGG